MDLGRVPLGSDFRQFIAAEVARSDLVLVLIGKHWLDTIRSKAVQSQDYVRAEIEIALAGNILTVPVLVGEETTLPQENELPPRIGRLAYLQGFRLLPERDFEEQVRRLITGLDHALALRESVALPSHSGKTEERSPVTRRPLKRRVETAELDLCWVEAGSFLMGSPNDEPGRWPDEGPRHEVVIPGGFWLGIAPVTQGQFQRVMEANPSYFQGAGEQAPIETVNWREAVEFCMRLQRSEPAPEGFTYRLPTEAEWEYACRAGAQTALYHGSLEILGSNHAPRLDPIAWYGGNSGVDYPGGVNSSSWFEKQYDHKTAGTHPVAQKASNVWGFFDTLGNVWEWCWDGKRLYQDIAVTQPVGPTDRGQRVIRGGSWEDGPGDCRCATRFAAGEKHRFSYVGFRLALAPVIR
jgi:formylglycine-generating enzyme required for sulfatase activity